MSRTPKAGWLLKSRSPRVGSLEVKHTQGWLTWIHAHPGLVDSWGHAGWFLKSRTSRIGWLLKSRTPRASSLEVVPIQGRLPWSHTHTHTHTPRAGWLEVIQGWLPRSHTHTHTHTPRAGWLEVIQGWLPRSHTHTHTHTQGWLTRSHTGLVASKSRLRTVRQFVARIYIHMHKCRSMVLGVWSAASSLTTYPQRPSYARPLPQLYHVAPLETLRPITRSFLSAAALLVFAAIISVVMADLCGATRARLVFCSHKQLVAPCLQVTEFQSLTVYTASASFDTLRSYRVLQVWLKDAECRTRLATRWSG